MTKIDHGIAIIGMHLRFPGANDTETFWRNLRDGVESITRFDREELLQSGIGVDVLDACNYVPASAVIDDIDAFDAAFFDMPPAEAEILDPQQRVFLELASQALERAGHDPQRPVGPIGVFAGAAANTYAAACNLIPPGGPSHITDIYDVMMGNDKDFLPARVSYKLNLRGPSVNVQTACSTSLVAIHLACQSLHAGECDVALAGGVSIMIPQRIGYTYREGMILSPDGHCRPFDARAGGIVGGHGAGIVVLRRLDDALADGDTIRAVIRGSAINNDGDARAGFTAPSIDGQSNVIAEALAVAKVPSASIGYVEAHGTGTAIGDPIEVQALARAFGSEGPQQCALGSVKSNIGHLNTASGVAGLIKAVLALEHKQIPGTLHFQSPNPRIDLGATLFVVSEKTMLWPQSKDYPRRAGVSSFGIGGSNAHVIVEEAPSEAMPESTTRRAGKPELLLLSARNPAAVAQIAVNLGSLLSKDPDTDLGHAAHTLATGRTAFAHRRYVVADSTAEAANALCRDQGAAVQGDEVLPDPQVAFLFAGQGSQYVGMGRELYKSYAAFRRNVDECCEVLSPALGRDLRTLMYPEQPSERDAQTLRQTEFAQPALFVLGHSLAVLWESWGVTAHGSLGHSIGEYVAACLAGVFTRDDALQLVAARGRLMQSMPAGAMLSVPLDEKAIQRWTGAEVALAAVNSPNNCVLSGSQSAIANLVEQLRASGVPYNSLETSHGFHSHLCDSILTPYAQRVAAFHPARPRARFISNVTGDWISDEQACSPTYWAQHLRQTVRFSRGVATLLSSGHRVLVELGPGVTVAPIVRQQTGSERCRIVSALPHHRADIDPLRHGLASLGAVWASGVDVRLPSELADPGRKRIELPTYPLERRRYWAQRGAAATTSSVPTARTRHSIDDWFYVRRWQRIRPARKAPTPVDIRQAWLVFADQADAGQSIAAELKRMGHRVIRIGNSEKADNTGDVFDVDPARDDAAAALFGQLQALLPNVSPNVVYAWSSRPDVTPETHLRFVMQLGVHLARRGEAKFLFVTEGVFDVLGNESIHPRQAILSGAAVVLPQEYPQLRVRLVDVDAAAIAAGSLWQQIIAGDAPVLAVRGNTTWLPQYQPIELPEDEPVRLRDQGLYLLTGGLGGIASVICEAIAERGNGARFALLSRSASATDPRAGALQQTLAGRGASLRVYRADVCDVTAMTNAVQQARRDFGSDIHGVVHCAGVVDETPMSAKSRDQIARVLAAKVRGTEVLDQVLGDGPLDFMVFCSSLASVLGAFGMADYCGANAFLDSFAAERSRRTGGQTLSIGWDGWRDIGMSDPKAMSKEQHHARRHAMPDTITPREGGAAFLRALTTGHDHVLVSKSDPNTRTLHNLGAATHQASPTPGQTGHHDRHPRPNLNSSYVPPKSDLEKCIADILAAALGIDRVGLNDNFFELGATSFLLVQMHAKLTAALGNSVFPPAVSLLFEHPNVASLARRISGAPLATGTPITDARQHAQRQRDALAAQRRAASNWRKS